MREMPPRTPAEPRAARSTKAVRGYELIVRGEVREHRIPEDKIVEVLLEEARKLAAEKELEAASAPE